MNSKSLKFLNVFQIVLFFAFALVALISAVYWIVSMFQISALYGIKDFIANNLYFLVLGMNFCAVDSLSSLSFMTTRISQAVVMCLSLFFFIWTLIIAIRLINAKEYNEKFRGGVLAGNIVFSLIFIYNAYIITTKQSIIENSTYLIAFCLNILFVIITILSLCINIKAKKSLSNNEMDNAEKLASSNSIPQQAPMRPMPPRPPMPQQNANRPMPPRPPVPPKRPNPPA